MKRSPGLCRIVTSILLVIGMCSFSTAAFSQPAPSLWSINHLVVDAEYSKQLDRIITVAASPENQLHIIDPVGQTDVAIDLPLSPSSVSVGPDGTHAAVGHDGWVSYIDLVAQTLVRVYPASAVAADIVLAGNGYVYVFPRVDQWESIRCLNLETGTETLSGPASIYAGTLAKLHPNGTKIYGADNGLSPSDIETYDISGGTATYLYDSPYHGDYPMCGNLWISEDGHRIFTRCGRVFRSSDIRSEDMTYNGSFSNLTSIAHLSHSQAVGKVAAIPANSSYPTVVRDNEVWLYEHDFLNFLTKVALPKFSVNGSSFTSHGKFVFFKSDGSSLFSIVKADDTAGILLNYAVATLPLSPEGNVVYTISASAGHNGTISPSGVQEVSGGDTISFTISPAEGYQVFDVLVDGVSVGRVTSYEFRGVGANHTISVSFWAPGKSSDYYPLLPGTIWTYQKDGTGSEKLKVLKNKAIVEGVETTIIQRSSDKSQQFYTSDDDGVKIHGGFRPSTYFPGYGYHAVYLTMIPPIGIAGAVPVPGQAVHSQGIVRGKVSGLGTVEAYYTADYTVTGVEAVTVPAGTFEALKLAYRLTMDGETETGELYLAKGIGEVKERYTVSGASVLYELVSANSGGQDLAVTSISAPASITFSKKTLSKTSPVKVVIQNRGLYPETIEDLTVLTNLVILKVESLGSCSDPLPDVSPQKKFPITIQPKASLVVSYNVTFVCVNDPASSTAKDPNHYDYRFTAVVNRAAIDGDADGHSWDDACPRSVVPPYIIDPYPDDTIRDKGCGARKSDGTFGGDILTDIKVVR